MADNIPSAEREYRDLLVGLAELKTLFGGMDSSIKELKSDIKLFEERFVLKIEHNRHVDRLAELENKIKTDYVQRHEVQPLLDAKKDITKRFWDWAVPILIGGGLAGGGLTVADKIKSEPAASTTQRTVTETTIERVPVPLPNTQVVPVTPNPYEFKAR